MLQRVWRLAIITALGRAWAQRSKVWLAIAGGLVIMRLVDQRAAKAGRKARDSA